MGYELKNKKWTPKSMKKMGEEGVLKEKAPSRSDSRPQSAKKTLFFELEGTEIEISGFMVQVLDLL